MIPLLAQVNLESKVLFIEYIKLFSTRVYHYHLYCIVVSYAKVCKYKVSYTLLIMYMNIL